MNLSQVLHSIVVFVAMAGLCRLAAAENICSETVPVNRQVDGIPAFAQCSTSTGSVYSNNGIDTRTTSGGTGWVRTQGSGGYQCTEFAHRYLAFRWNIASVPAGNAGTWCANTPPSGLVKTTVPVHGDIIVFAPGSCGASTTAGHVAVVDVVNATTVTIVEQNGASRRTCAISCANCFLHVQANTNAIIERIATDAARDDANIRFHEENGRVSIQLDGSLKNGSSIRVFDLFGRQKADLTDCIKNGRTISGVAKLPSGAFVVLIQNGDRGLCKKIFVGH
jgi:surface antigen